MATSDDNAGHHSVIKYCEERGMTPGQTIKKMKLSQTHQNVSRILVYKRHKLSRLDGVTAGPKKADRLR